MSIKTCTTKPLFKTAVIISAVMVSGGFSQSLEHLTISEAINLACDHNPKVRQYREKVEEKKWDNRATVGNFLPTVTLSGGYTAMDNALVMDLDPIREAMISLQSKTYTKMAVDSFTRANGAGITQAMLAGFSNQYNTGITTALENAVPHFIDTLKEKNYPSGNITVMQPIFMGGKIIAANKAASAEKKAAMFELAKSRDETIQETFNNYCAIALIKQVIMVRGDVLDGMSRHEKNARILYETGAIAKTNVLRAQVAVAEARRTLDDEINRLSLAKLALAKSLNVSDTIVIDTYDTLSPHEIPQTMQCFINKADSLQPILPFIKAKTDMARAKMGVERASLLPRIAAFGRIELFPDYLSALEPQWAYGVNMSMDLFAGGKNISRFASASHLVKETEAMGESARQDVRLWVKKAFLECTNANSRYRQLSVDEKLATENLRQCQSRFESGFGTSLDVIDAELALEKNRIEKLASLYDFHKSYMDLCTASGQPEQALQATFLSKEKL